MEEQSYPVRFISDEHFIKELLKDKELAVKVILKLCNIHRTSKHYPMTHNLIPDESFKNAIKDKEIRGHALLGAFHPETWQDFVINEKDFECKMIKYAINTATKKPYIVVLLTSSDRIEIYQKNEHYQNNQIKKAVRIASGEFALKLIDIVASIED